MSRSPTSPGSVSSVMWGGLLLDIDVTVAVEVTMATGATEVVEVDMVTEATEDTMVLGVSEVTLVTEAMALGV